MKLETVDVLILLCKDKKTYPKAALTSLSCILCVLINDESFQVHNNKTICLLPGLSVPVPRGRKGKKLKNQLNIPETKSADWMVHCNPEVVLHDESYKKHLKQHCNKLVCASLF